MFGEFIDAEEYLNKIFNEEFSKSLINEMVKKIEVLDKREERKIAKKYRKREAKFKKMLRIIS